jgi:hypothetical protein
MGCVMAMGVGLAMTVTMSVVLCVGWYQSETHGQG